MPLTVRDAVPGDARALAHVVVTATRTTFTGLVPDTCLTWLTESERAGTFQQALARGDDPGEALGRAEEAKSAETWGKSLIKPRKPGAVLLAAEEDGVVVGYASGRPSAGDPVYRGEIEQMAVLPSHQGRGVGRLLFREVARRLAAYGIHSLRVGVLRVNPNRAFYEHLGGQYLYDRDFDWEGSIQPECFYGWRDTRNLLVSSGG